MRGGLFLCVQPRRRRARSVETLRASTKGALTIDAYLLLRLALAIAATVFLVAAFVISVWMSRSNRHDRMLRPSEVVFLLGLLAALSILMSFAPPGSAESFPTAQVILLAVSAVVLSMSLTMRKYGALGTAQLVDTATVDALTRVASHRLFQDRLAHECDRAYRFGDCFMLMMLDLDDFHQVNNRYGHRIGDRILLDLARRVKTQLREIDLLARFGGDRFVMILPHTYERGGVEVAERLRQHMAGWVYVSDQGVDIRVTVSVGLCSYPTDGGTPPELVEVVQKALVFAKAMGGNQIQLFRDLPSREAPSNVVSLPNFGRGAIVRSLNAAVDVRDGYTHEHSRLVSELSAAIARRIGLATVEVTRIRVGALLHDVGKIGVPDAVLAKEGGLSQEEWDSIRRHPVLGKQIMEQAPELTDVIPLVLHHQERYDGTGYPSHLRGESIPLGARIIAAADAYHAIRSDRPYRSGRTHGEAIGELRRCSGGQFDPMVVDTLLSILETDDVLRGLLLPDSERLGSGAPTARAAAVFNAAGFRD
jgi:diguanylate cyclase (GGDEF)-like protein/putative nucleotidyltransferase with HDIG domain